MPFYRGFRMKDCRQSHGSSPFDGPQFLWSIFAEMLTNIRISQLVWRDLEAQYRLIPEVPWFAGRSSSLVGRHLISISSMIHLKITQLVNLVVSSDPTRGQPYLLYSFMGLYYTHISYLQLWRSDQAYLTSYMLLAIQHSLQDSEHFPN